MLPAAPDPEKVCTGPPCPMSRCSQDSILSILTASTEQLGCCPQHPHCICRAAGLASSASSLHLEFPAPHVLPGNSEGSSLSFPGCWGFEFEPIRHMDQEGTDAGGATHRSQWVWHAVPAQCQAPASTSAYARHQVLHRAHLWLDALTGCPNWLPRLAAVSGTGSPALLEHSDCLTSVRVFLSCINKPGWTLLLVTQTLTGRAHEAGSQGRELRTPHLSGRPVVQGP